MFQPIQFAPRWTPGIGYAVFEFGRPIVDLVRDGSVSGGSPDERRPGIETYWSEDLGCYVDVSNGAIDTVRTETVCQYRGFNLIGSHQRAVSSLLDRELQWIHPEGLFTEFVDVPELGLMLEACINTESVMIATMTAARKFTTPGIFAPSF